VASITIRELKQAIREELCFNEALFGGEGRYEDILDSVLRDLYDTNKKLERAHQLAPSGPSKAIVMGLHSDLFNKAAEFRKYVAQLKAMAKKEKQ